MAQAKIKTTTRRAVIATATGLTAAAALRVGIAPAPAAEPAGDPLLALCADYARQEAAAAAAGGDDAAVDEIADAMCEIEREIADTPATSAAGSLARLAICESEVRTGVDEDAGPDVIQGLVLSVIADFRRFLEASRRT